MPTTDTLTDEQVVEILAKKGMGYERVAWETIEGRLVATPKGAGRIERWHWNPLTDLNACHEVEERLTERQRAWYSTYLRAWARSQGPESQDEYEFLLTHAPATIKAHNLAEVLRG